VSGLSLDDPEYSCPDTFSANGMQIGTCVCPQACSPSGFIRKEQATQRIEATKEHRDEFERLLAAAEKTENRWMGWQSRGATSVHFARSVNTM
jgi:hypothetical protein